MISLNPNTEDRFISNEDLESAMVLARWDAIREHQRFGSMMIFERDGQIVHVDPYEAEADLLRSHPELATRQLTSGAAMKR